MNLSDLVTHTTVPFSNRGGEWYHETRGSRKILAGSQNFGSVFDKSRSLVFAWFVFTFFESRNFLPKSLRLGFLTRISESRRVSDFTIRHPFKCYSCSNMTSFCDLSGHTEMTSTVVTYLLRFMICLKTLLFMLVKL